MYYEEHHVTFIEDEGCCSAVIFKLRRRRHIVIITLLLISAIVSVVTGLWNGLSLKKYSDLAIFVGIFFPGIILVFICIYLAFICGRESLRTSVLSRMSHLSGVNHRDEEDLSYRRRGSTTRDDDLRARYHSKANPEFKNDQTTYRDEEPRSKEPRFTTDDSADYRGNKIKKRHFRSLSNSDISRENRKNCEVLSKESYRKNDGHQYSPRSRKHQGVTSRKKFKRSVSDTTGNSKNTKSTVDKRDWNTQSLYKLKRNVEQLNSLKDAGGHTDFEHSSEISKRTETPCSLEKYTNTDEYKNSVKLKCGNGVLKYKTKEGYASGNAQEDTQRQSCYNKSEIRLYSSNALKLPYKQILEFKNVQPDRKDDKDIEDSASCSSADEKYDSFSRSDTLEMEKKSKKFENYLSEHDTYRLRRKAIYLPSSSNKESKQPPKEFAHEYCRYSKKGNKTKQKSFSRN